MNDSCLDAVPRPGIPAFPMKHQILTIRLSTARFSFLQINLYTTLCVSSGTPRAVPGSHARAASHRHSSPGHRPPHRSLTTRSGGTVPPRARFHAHAGRNRPVVGPAADTGNSPDPADNGHRLPASASLHAPVPRGRFREVLSTANTRCPCHRRSVSGRTFRACRGRASASKTTLRIAWCKVLNSFSSSLA